MLVLGAGGIVLALRRWSRTPRLAATADDDALVDERACRRASGRRVSDLDREALEAERDFLLRSLDDLEAERAAGNVDDDTYRTLHDDYTARAAAVDPVARRRAPTSRRRAARRPSKALRL